MSRSGYSDDVDQLWDWIRHRGAVKSALRGRHGQAFLREMLAALYALPEKRLIQNDLVDEYDGAVCALGAVGRARGLDMADIDSECPHTVANEFDVADAMACEIMWVNDEGGFWKESAEARWLRVRHWVVDHIIDESSSSPSPLSESGGLRG